MKTRNGTYRMIESPEIIKIPHVLNFEREYLSARQPRDGFAKPIPTPVTRAVNN